jgi:hypothetical protein
MRSRRSRHAALLVVSGLMVGTPALWAVGQELAGPQSLDVMAAATPPGASLTLTGETAADAPLAASEGSPPAPVSSDVRVASEPRPAAASGVRPVPVVDATKLPSLAQEPPPRLLAAPDLGIEAPVRSVGVDADGQMELPDDPRVLGWYRFGPAPGSAKGSTVVAAHVDSLEYGVGPLARLAGATPGQRIDVTMRDGSTLRYRVSAVEQLDKAGLPLDRLFAENGRHLLRIVTCGGDFIEERGSYEDNIVLTAVPL